MVFYDTLECFEKWTEIVPGLYQGGRTYRSNRRAVSLVKVGEEFDHVITFFYDPPAESARRLLYGPHKNVSEEFYPMRDGVPTAEDVAEVQRLAWDVVKRLAKGEKVLIRCAGGLNRSGFLVATVLMYQGWSPEDAIALIRRKRSEYALYNNHFVAIILK
jgi:hypothetical protein